MPPRKSAGKRSGGAGTSLARSVPGSVGPTPFQRVAAGGGPFAGVGSYMDQLQQQRQQDQALLRRRDALMRARDFRRTVADRPVTPAEQAGNAAQAGIWRAAPKIGAIAQGTQNMPPMTITVHNHYYPPGRDPTRPNAKKAGQ
jgi:hypothetical protein